MANTEHAPYQNRRCIDVADELLVKNDYKDSQTMYDALVRTGKYDDMMVEQMQGYKGLPMMIDMMKKFFPKPGQTRVLDLGAGTGVVGEALHAAGFRNIDALEPCDAFVAKIRALGIHKNILEQCVGGDAVIGAKNDFYDAVVTAGTFCPGHIPCDALHELIRIIKPGGYFLNCMRSSYLTYVPEYKNRLVPLTEQLEKENKWKKIAWVEYENHFYHHSGTLMVFQIC